MCSVPTSGHLAVKCWSGRSSRRAPGPAVITNLKAFLMIPYTPALPRSFVVALAALLFAVLLLACALPAQAQEDASPPVVQQINGRIQPGAGMQVYRVAGLAPGDTLYAHMQHCLRQPRPVRSIAGGFRRSPGRSRRSTRQICRSCWPRAAISHRDSRRCASAISLPGTTMAARGTQPRLNIRSRPPATTCCLPAGRFRRSAVPPPVRTRLHSASTRPRC